MKTIRGRSTDGRTSPLRWGILPGVLLAANLSVLAGDSLQVSRGMFVGLAGGPVVAASPSPASGRVLRGSFGYSFEAPFSVGVEVMTGVLAMRPVLPSGGLDVAGDFGSGGIVIAYEPVWSGSTRVAVEGGVGLATILSDGISPMNGRYFTVGVACDAGLFGPVMLGGGIRYTRTAYHARGGGVVPGGVSPDSRVMLELRLGIGLGPLP